MSNDKSPLLLNVIINILSVTCNITIIKSVHPKKLIRIIKIGISQRKKRWNLWTKIRLHTMFGYVKLLGREMGRSNLWRVCKLSHGCLDRNEKKKCKNLWTSQEALFFIYRLEYQWIWGKTSWVPH